MPAILFNEKVMAGLGRGLAATGAIDPVALDKARVALARFASLAREMGVTSLRTVATAAVRLATCAQSMLALSILAVPMVAQLMSAASIVAFFTSAMAILASPA